jgi:hypothetical protein
MGITVLGLLRFQQIWYSQESQDKTGDLYNSARKLLTVLSKMAKTSLKRPYIEPRSNLKSPEDRSGNTVAKEYSAKCDDKLNASLQLRLSCNEACTVPQKSTAPEVKRLIPKAAQKRPPLKS